MITDFIFGTFHALLSMLIGLLGDAEPLPQTSRLSEGLSVLGLVNWWLPIREMAVSLGFIAAGWSALLVFRIVRLLNPLGG